MTNTEESVEQDTKESKETAWQVQKRVGTAEVRGYISLPSYQRHRESLEGLL